MRASGIIGYNDSGDCFRVSAGAGALTARVDVMAAWTGWDAHNRANLDTKLSLLSSTGAVLTTNNPTGQGGPQGQAPRRAAGRSIYSCGFLAGVH